MERGPNAYWTQGPKTDGQAGHSAQPRRPRPQPAWAGDGAANSAHAAPPLPGRQI